MRQSADPVMSCSHVSHPDRLPVRSHEYSPLCMQDESQLHFRHATLSLDLGMLSRLSTLKISNYRVVLDPTSWPPSLQTVALTGCSLTWPDSTPYVPPPALTSGLSLDIKCTSGGHDSFTWLDPRAITYFTDVYVHGGSCVLTSGHPDGAVPSLDSIAAMIAEGRVRNLKIRSRRVSFHRNEEVKNHKVGRLAASLTATAAFSVAHQPHTAEVHGELVARRI